MIIYFSGTGNSLAISRQIADSIDDCVMPLAQAVKTDLTAEKRIGLVYPTYDFNAPKAVRLLQPQLRISREAYVFIIITCGAQAGLSSYWAVRMLRKAGIKVAYTHKIRVPDCSALAFGRNPNIQTWKFARYASRLQQIISDIQKETHRHHFSGWSFIGQLMLLPKLDAWAYRSLMPSVNQEKCIGCGTCEKVCPIGNIRLIENVQTNQRVASIGQECSNCLSCVHFCPQQALELNGRETDKSYQYHHPSVSVKDILKARENRD